MRNGINISNISEFVHEVQQNPAEADLRYGIRLRSRGDRLANVETRTMRAGTIVVPRDFSFSGWVGASEPQRQDPSAMEILLAAMGGCVLMTFIYGASSKGMILTGLSAEMRAQAAQGVPTFRWTLDVAADGSDEQLADLAQQVTNRSPNHRSLAEENTLLFNVSISANDGLECWEFVEKASGSALDVPETTAHVRWDYGTQLTAIVPMSHSASRECQLAIDVPKQYLGIDKAPNPQEYLLGALATDLATQFRRLSQREGIVVDEFAADVFTRVDIRGVLNVSPEARVAIHGTTVDLRVTVSDTLSRAKQLVDEAIASSVVRSLICNCNCIAVAVQREGRPLREFETKIARS
jgi:uncharacterized OsmC-like protein